MPRRPSTTWAATLAALSTVLAGVAVQRDVLGVRGLPWIPTLWGAVGLLGLAAWLLIDRAVAARAAAAPTPAAARPVPARIAGAAVLAAGLLAFVVSAVLLYRDLTSGPGGYLWLLAIALLVVGLCLWEQPPWPRLAFGPGRGERLVTALLVLVVAGALLLRLVALDRVPAGLNNDEGEVADMGLNLLHRQPLAGQHNSQPGSPFQTGWGTTPLLDPVIHAVVMQGAGETIAGLRLSSAVAGGLGVLLLFALVRLVASAWAALAVATMMALSHMHLFWTRFALPQAKLALLATAIVWLVIRGLRQPGYLSWVAAGICLGLAQYTYQGARFMVLILAPFFLYMVVRDRRFLAERWTHVAVMVASSIVVFAPLGIWFWQHPAELFSRTGAVVIFSDPGYVKGTYPGLNTVQIVIEQLRRSLEGLAFSGDRSGAFYPMRVPMLDPIAAALVLAGVLGLSFSLRHPDRVLIALWIWVPIALTCTVTVDPPPMTRLFIMWPALFVVAGLVIDRLGWAAHSAGGRRLLSAFAGMLAVGLAYSALWNYQTFFVQYPRELPASVWTVAGQLVRASGPDTKTYMLGPPHLYFFNSTMRFLTRGMAGDDIQEKDLPVAERGYRAALFIVSAQQTPALARLRSLYPGGELREHRTPRGDLFFTSYLVDPGTFASRVPPDAIWRQWDDRFGQTGSAFGQFRDGRALAVDRAGRVYLADRGNGRIDVFTHEGKPIAAVGHPGDGPGAFRELWSVAVADDDSVFGLDRQTRWINHFDRDGKFLGRIGGPDILSRPSGLAVMPDGNLLIADTGHNVVFQIDPTGIPLGRIGRPGKGLGELDAPVAVAANEHGIYVVEAGSARVQQFSPSFEPRRTWPIPRTDPNLGPMIAATGDAIYVVDPPNGRIQRYGLDGQPEWAIGSRGDGVVQFHLPLAIAPDPAGNLFVLDSQRSLIYRYDLSRASEVATASLAR